MLFDVNFNDDFLQTIEIQRNLNSKTQDCCCSPGRRCKCMSSFVKFVLIINETESGFIERNFHPFNYLFDNFKFSISTFSKLMSKSETTQIFCIFILPG